jgi:hypothetical protein
VIWKRSIELGDALLEAVLDRADAAECLEFARCRGRPDLGLSRSAEASRLITQSKEVDMPGSSGA